MRKMGENEFKIRMLQGLDHQYNLLCQILVLAQMAAEKYLEMPQTEGQGDIPSGDWFGRMSEEARNDYLDSLDE